jgi:hypothetical protein
MGPVSSSGPAPTERSVLVVYQRNGETDTYIVPNNEENRDLLDDLFLIDGTSQDAGGLTDAQYTAYEGLESNLEPFYFDGIIRNVNIGDVVRLAESTLGGIAEEEETAYSSEED